METFFTYNPYVPDGYHRHYMAVGGWALCGTRKVHMIANPRKVPIEDCPVCKTVIRVCKEFQLGD